MEYNYEYTSPYRNKTKPEKYRDNKWQKKLIRQTVISIFILILLAIVIKTPNFKTSNIWQSIVYMLGYDIDLEKSKEAFYGAVTYVKNNIEEESKSVINKTEKVEEKKIEGGEPAVLNEMQKDVSDILEKTSVIRPVAGVATSRFGKRVLNGKEETHTGVDLEASIGTPVKSAISGTVSEVKKIDTSFGNFLRITNADIVTTYAHCSSIEVKEGDKIKQGEIIAYSGDSGNVTGPHLHFEVTKSGRYVDPGFLLTYAN